MCCPRMPLSRTCDDAVEKLAAIQFLHLAGKPICCKRERMYSQRTELKVFEMSSFKSSIGVLLLSNRLAIFHTYMKLSWMLRPLIKALWLLEMICCIAGASLSAKIFASSFVML